MNVTRARANITGGSDYPAIRGLVTFTQVPGGTMVYADIFGLPAFSRSNGKAVGPHGFHIHSGNSCGDDFSMTGMHYNPDNRPHGNHAGDFPVLFSNGGRARTTFYTDRFKPSDITGMTVLIHESPDDYRTEPAGNSGRKIACGTIQRY